MYLIISEGGEIHKTVEITEDDLACYDAGIIEIVDISNPSDPLYYYGEGWGKVEEYGDPDAEIPF